MKDAQALGGHVGNWVVTVDDADGGANQEMDGPAGS